MLMAKYGSVVYLYLTVFCWELIALMFTSLADASPITVGRNENDALRQFNEESLQLHPSYEGHTIAELPFELQKTARKYLNYDGISDTPIIYGSADAALTNQEKKATRNFLRFGRGQQKNFLRFGRNPLDTSLGLLGEELDQNSIDKRGKDRNFLRFGRGNSKNFIRFGRTSDRNFIRFGRSASKELGKCKDCDSMNSSKQKSAKSDSDDSTKRDKRSIPAFYDDMLFMAPTPLSWIENLSGFGPNPSDDININGQGGPVTANGQKRAHSFLRYGRDPLDLHFLRYGKRGMPSGPASQQDQEGDFPREARMSKNFLRFG